MTDKEPDRMLERLFEEARAAQAPPSEAFLARLAADAAAEVPRPARPPERLRSILWGLVGGWAGAGGLAAATVAGLWIGIAPPAAVSDLAAGMWGGTTSVSLLPAADPFAAGPFPAEG